MKVSASDIKAIWATIHRVGKRFGFSGLRHFLAVEFEKLPPDRAAELRPRGWSICINTRYWNGYTRREKNAIIAHEVCHWIDIVRHGLAPGEGHRASFWEILKLSGYGDAKIHDASGKMYS